MSCERRRKIVDLGHPVLSVRRQCEILILQPSTYYYQPIGESAYNLVLMKRIDKLFLELPFFGSRQMRNFLRDEGHPIGRNRVRRLMRQMGLMAVYQRPKTSYHIRSTRRIRTCYGARRLQGQTRSGVPTSHIFRCGADSCTLWQLWTGTAERCSPSAYRTPWMLISVSLPWTMQ